MLGRWVAFEGLVYDVFDPREHIIDMRPNEIPPSWRRIISIDFGFNHPFVAQWWAIDPEGRMYRYREIYKTGRLVEDHAKDIKRLSEGERIEAIETRIKNLNLNKPEDRKRNAELLNKQLSNRSKVF